MQTIIKFEVLDFEENNTLLINKLYLEHEKKTINIKNKIITVKIDKFPINVDDFYVDKLILYTNDKKYIEYLIRIYKSETNNFYIFLNKIYNNSFHILYFDKIKIKPPEILSIKDNNNIYNIKEIFKNDLSFVKEFAIINCKDTFSINNNQEICVKENGSFEIDFISKNSTYQMNVQKIKKESYPTLIINEKTRFKLIAFVNNIKENLYNKEMTKIKFSKFITGTFLVSEKIDIANYNYFISNKIYPIDEKSYEYLLNFTIYLIASKVNEHTEAFIILKTYFKQLEFLEEKFKKNIINRKDILSFSNWFKNNYTSAEVLKAGLNGHFDNFEDIYENSTDKWLNYQITFIKEINKECSYFKAFQFLNEVISNLNEDSKLLEILYLIDSGTGFVTNRKEENKKAFNLTSISKKSIINHIKNIIPNIIIRKNKKDNVEKTIFYSDAYAEFDIYSGLIIFYEETLFKMEIDTAKKILIEDEDKYDKYVMSIYKVLLHEICSHCKLELRNFTIESPNIINDPYNNYEELKLKRGEMGRVMEYYINKDIKKIKFLKFDFSSKSKLLKKELWVNKNFDELDKNIDELIKDNNDLSFEENEIGFFPGDNESEENNNSEKSSESLKDYTISKEDKSKKLKKKEKEFNYNDFIIFPKVCG